MGDVLTPTQRRHCMSRIRGRDTKPEVALRKALWALGLRYNLTSKLPGKPDLVFPKHRAALFVDGCFWHKCPKHWVAPGTNANFWRLKLEANVRRDAHVNHELRSLNWKVVRVWEHDVKTNPGRVANRLYSRIHGTRGKRL